MLIESSASNKPLKEPLLNKIGPHRAGGRSSGSSDARCFLLDVSGLADDIADVEGDIRGAFVGLDQAGPRTVNSFQTIWHIRTPPTSKLKMLYESGALISGSAALKVLSGKPFPPHDIDFVVADSRVHILKHYLESRGFKQDRSFNNSAHYFRVCAPSFHIEWFAQQEWSVDVTITTVSNRKLVDALTRSTKATHNTGGQDTI